jgi:hypothetical protein
MFENSRQVQPPHSPDSVLQDFIRVGKLKALVYYGAIEKEQTLHKLVLGPVRTLAIARTYESVRRSNISYVRVCLD